MRNGSIYNSVGLSQRSVKPPRRLDIRIKHLIHDKLSGYVGVQKVHILIPSSDTETFLYAEQIRDYLKENGWNVKPEIEVISGSALQSGTSVRISPEDKNTIELVV